MRLQGDWSSDVALPILSGLRQASVGFTILALTSSPLTRHPYLVTLISSPISRHSYPDQATRAPVCLISAPQRAEWAIGRASCREAALMGALRPPITVVS